MTSFSASTEASAVVVASRQQIWDVLTDADLVAAMTPFVTGIEDRGTHWIWSMTRLPVPKATLSPRFTQKMTCVDLERIDFTHEPPAGAEESTGVEGWYVLADAETRGDEAAATLLRTSLTITVDLPLPHAMGPAVTVSMRSVIRQMGNKFSANMLEHLGTTSREVSRGVPPR